MCFTERSDRVEKRFYLGTGILVFLLVLGLLTGRSMAQFSEETAAFLEQAEAAILSGNTQTGTELAQQARRLWQKRWHLAALVADHSPMDEIDGLFAQMEFFAKTEDLPRLGACCARVAELVEAVADAHTLRWWNVL